MNKTLVKNGDVVTIVQVSDRQAPFRETLDKTMSSSVTILKFTKYTATQNPPCLVPVEGDNFPTLAFVEGSDIISKGNGAVFWKIWSKQMKNFAGPATGDAGDRKDTVVVFESSATTMLCAEIFEKMISPI